MVNTSQMLTESKFLSLIIKVVPMLGAFWRLIKQLAKPPLFTCWDIRTKAEGKFKIDHGQRPNGSRLGVKPERKAPVLGLGLEASLLF